MDLVALPAQYFASVKQFRGIWLSARPEHFASCRYYYATQIPICRRKKEPTCIVPVSSILQRIFISNSLKEMLVLVASKFGQHFTVSRNALTTVGRSLFHILPTITTSKLDNLLWTLIPFTFLILSPPVEPVMMFPSFQTLWEDNIWVHWNTLTPYLSCLGTVLTRFLTSRGLLTFHAFSYLF